MPTDKFVFNGKGKLPFNKMLNEAIEFGIEREAPKLEPHQMIKVVVTKADDGVIVDVLRVDKNEK